MSTHTTPVASPVENINLPVENINLPVENVVEPPAPKKRGRKPKDPNAEPQSKKTTVKKSKDPNAEPKPKKTTTKKTKKTVEPAPVEKISGEEPVEKISGEEPVEKISGEESVEKISGEEPVEKISGEEPVEKISGEEPVEKISGEEPAKKNKPLSAKHAKFIHYSFYLLEQLNLQGANIDPDVFYNAAHIFDTTPNQASFVDDFINNSKTHTNRFKDLLKSRKKSNKPNKPTKSKKSKNSNNNDLVNDLVLLAQHNNDNDNHNDNHNLLQVSEFVHNNSQFLIDNDNNIYHFTKHTCIGKLNTDNNTPHLF
jgi:hypothetical protein